MNIDTLPNPPPTPTTGDQAASGSLPSGESAIPEGWKPLFGELTTYYRHLPCLLREGEAGRHVVIRGDQVYGTWDSYRDASQYGRERFGVELFMVHRVDPRDVERLAPYFAAEQRPCPG